MFWLKQPSEICKNATLIPQRNMSDEELLNTISRLIIVVGIILCLFSIYLGLTVIILGLIVVIIIWYCGGYNNNIRAIGNFTCEKTIRRRKKNICKECSKKKSFTPPVPRRRIRARY